MFEYWIGSGPRGWQMDIASRRPHARMTLLGVFRLEDAAAVAIPIRSRKARALLGILALSRNGERTRAWLQSMLWCRCERMEAQNSLRREISTLRATLKAAGLDLLDVARDTVRFRIEACDIDALGGGRADGEAPDMSRLLEGFDIPGEEQFEEWLRETRASSTSPAIIRLPDEAMKPRVVGLEDNRLTVQIRLEAWHDGSPLADFLPEMLRQQIFVGLDETGYFRALAELLDLEAEHGSAPDIRLWIKTTLTGETLGLIIFANVSTSQTLLFSLQDAVEVQRGSWDRAMRRIRDIAANCVDRMIRKCIANDAFGGESHQARKSLLTAVEQMFSLNAHQVRASRATLANAAGIDSLAVFHAWKAYQSIFLHDHAHSYDYRLTLEECRDNVERALAIDPHSGLALSLCAHVEAFQFHDFAAAGDLIERAGAAGTRHVMYFDALALLRFYTGDYRNAREAAYLAAAAGQNLPFRYCFSTTLCMIEAMSGNLESAITFGRRARAQEPSRKSISYPPTLRYLGAALALNGATSEARGVFGGLCGTGDTATIADLATGVSAVPGRGCADLIRAGLRAAGL